MSPVACHTLTDALQSGHKGREVGPPPHRFPAMTTTFTATLPDGTTATRKSAARAYTHCVAQQSSSGQWFAHSWAGRPDLALKAAAKIGGRAIEATVAHVTERKVAMTKNEACRILNAAGYRACSWTRFGRYTVAPAGVSLDDEAGCLHLTLVELRKLAAAAQAGH